MTITDKWATVSSEVACSDEGETWDLIRDVLNSVRKSTFEPGEVSDASSLLRRGQLAASQPLFLEFVNKLESATSLWKSKGHALISDHLERDPSCIELSLTASQKTFLTEQAFQAGLQEMEAELARMKNTLSEIQLDIDKWGDEKPVRVRYEELLKQKRSYWTRSLKRAAAAAIIAGVSALSLLTHSVWLTVIVGTVCFIYIACVLFSASWNAGELGWGEAWGDSELVDFVKQHHKYR